MGSSTSTAYQVVEEVDDSQGDAAQSYWEEEASVPMRNDVGGQSIIQHTAQPEDAEEDDPDVLIDETIIDDEDDEDEEGDDYGDLTITLTDDAVSGSRVTVNEPLETWSSLPEKDKGSKKTTAAGKGKKTKKKSTMEEDDEDGSPKLRACRSRLAEKFWCKGCVHKQRCLFRDITISECVEEEDGASEGANGNDNGEAAGGGDEVKGVDQSYNNSAVLNDSGVDLNASVGTSESVPPTITTSKDTGEGSTEDSSDLRPPPPKKKYKAGIKHEDFYHKIYRICKRKRRKRKVCA